MTTIALNVETCPIPEKTNDLPPPEVKLGNLKDPEKIKAKQQEAVSDAIERLALDPHYSRVLCVSLVMRKPEGIKAVTVIVQPQDEARILNSIWSKVWNADGSVRLVTFNGSNFDIPFMRCRSIFNKVAAPYIECSPYKTRLLDSQHVDIMHVIHSFAENNPTGLPRKLSNLAKLYLGIDWPFAEVNQSRLLEMTESGQGDTVRALCEWNATRTFELYEAIQPYLL